MNDIPEDFVLVAERLSRALVADGDAIERDARARLASTPLPVTLGETLESGPSIDVEIGGHTSNARRHPRSRLLFAIAAVVVVSLAVVVSLSRRDSGTVVTGGDGVRYFLPATLPEGYGLNGVNVGFGNRPPAFDLWRRVYTQRDGGALRRVLVIDSTTPFSAVDPLTEGQPVTVGGRPAVFSLTDRGIFAWIKDDFGCGYVTVGAIGYEIASAPPSDLLGELASIECAPTSAGGSAAAITVQRGFTLEYDHDAVDQASPGWNLSYADASGKLTPFSFNFGVSGPSPDLTVTVAGGSAKRIKRNGRDYWTATPLPVTSDRGAYVAWNSGPYLVTLSSVDLGLDELLVIADSVHEVDKATFDDAVRLAQTISGTTR